MFKHIINFFRVNIALKLISVAIAFALWLMAFNVSNPEISESVTLDITVNNGDELLKSGKTFTLDARSVKITYRVRSNDRNKISPSSFNAYVNMKDYSITGAVPVYVNTDSSVLNLMSGVSWTPMVAHVTTEDMQEKEFAVTAKINGEAAEGFVAGDAILDPATVSLYGPKSEIGKISRVGIVLDISGAEEEQTGVGKIQFFDANDNVIALGDKVSVNSEIGYTVPVYRTKSLSINVPTVGQPAPGYTLNGVETDPSFVQVYGEDTVLGRYNTIYLPDGILDISGASSNVTISLPLKDYLPEGLHLQQQAEVIIAAKIVRQTDLRPGGGYPPAAIVAPTAEAHTTAPETTAQETEAESPQQTEEPELPTAHETTETQETTSVHVVIHSTSEAPAETTEHTVHETEAPVIENEPQGPAVHETPQQEQSAHSEESTGAQGPGPGETAGGDGSVVSPAVTERQ